MDVTFQDELEKIFRESFLASAPLYREAGKIKLPFEDAKKITTLYRGSLSEETRQVETIADYELYKNGYPGDQTVKQDLSWMAKQAGTLADGLIRMENVRNALNQDPRDTINLKVVDIFSHSDGRRNLQVMLAKDAGPSVNGPDAILPSWISYRFYFACASIRMEYKK